MESKHETPSVILKLMGLDKVPPLHPVRDTQKVLSEKYLQKVASIGVRKKRSSHRHHSFRMSTYGKEESEDAFEVVKTIRRDKHHNPSKGNGKENPILSATKGKGSARTGNVSNKVLDTVSSSFFRGNEAFAKSSDMLMPASNISVNEIQCNSPFFCSYVSYVGSEAKNKTLKERDVTENLQEVGQRGHGSTHHQLPMTSEHGNGARTFSYQSGFSNGKIKSNILCKVGANYSFARKVPTTRPLCAASVIADNHVTVTKDDLFQKYWGLRKNASANWSTLKSKYQNINQNDCLEDMNHRSSSEKSSSFSSYFNGNHIEENFIGLHKLKKRCYGNDLSDKDPMLPQLSRSGPSPTFIDSQIMQETCSRNDEVKNYKHEDNNMSKQNSTSPNSSVDCLVSDAKIEVVGRSHINPTKQQSESTASIWLHRDSDSLNHSSHASTQQDTSEFQEDSVYSLCSGTEPDSTVSLEGAYEPSPVSVLDLTFREDISSSSECLEVVGTGVYDSSEVDDEGFGLNVSSDEDWGVESVGDFKEKQDLVGLFRADESRDFSYVVEVLTEAGHSNRSLFTDPSTWHCAECPISPFVFEILEKKFGEQQLWKRSERRLLFDRINLGLLEILQPCSYIPTWEKPVKRRLNAEPSQDMIEEEMWGLLVAEEKEASNESADKMLSGEIRWTELGDDTEVIVSEIVKLLIEELANEIVSLENF